jgi:hypothetical protein
MGVSLRGKAGWFVVVGWLTLLGWVNTGCDDPLAVEWYEVPDTVLLYSLARPELNLLSAMDLLSGYPLRIESPEATGNWDFVLDTSQGDLVLTPPGVFGIASTARIMALEGVSLESVAKAPADSTLHSSDTPLPVKEGVVYVIRTRQVTDLYENTCVYYAKLEPITVELALQSLSFHYVLNPTCNSRDLVPRS